MDRLRISFRGVRFAYQAGVTVLDVPELEIGPGLTLLRGANGAGKTTLLRLAAGVERPDAGTIAIDGRDLWVEEARARKPIAYVPEQPDLTPYATIAEILSLVARLRVSPPVRRRRRSPPRAWRRSPLGRSVSCPRANAGGPSWPRR
mgnify:CR=1 FL=1